MERPEIKVNVTNQEGNTPLYEAADWRRLEAVRMLLARSDVDPNLTGKADANPPLVEAAKSGTAEMVELFLKRDDIDVNKVGLGIRKSIAVS